MPYSHSHAAFQLLQRELSNRSPKVHKFAFPRGLKAIKKEKLFDSSKQSSSNQKNNNNSISQMSANKSISWMSSSKKLHLSEQSQVIKKRTLPLAGNQNESTYQPSGDRAGAKSKSLADLSQSMIAPTWSHQEQELDASQQHLPRPGMPGRKLTYLRSTAQ